MKVRFAVTVIAISVASFLSADEKPKLRPTKSRAQHEFLKQFVGEWERTTEMFLRPGKSTTSKGTMSAKMLGDFWIVLDLKGDFAGNPYHGRATYGFDTLKKKKYVGVFTDTMAPIMWNYEGQADGNKLIMETEGPHPMMRGSFKFRNTWSFKAKDVIELHSEMEGRDGKMVTILKSTCRRKTAK